VAALNVIRARARGGAREGDTEERRERAHSGAEGVQQGALEGQGRRGAHDIDGEEVQHLRAGVQK